MTEAIIPQTPALDQPDTPDPTQTELIPRDFGIYDAIIRGHLITLYCDDYPSALKQFHELLNERRTEHPTPTWYICQGCGVSLDIGQPCIECLMWLTETEATPDHNNETWLTENLPPTTGMQRQIEEAVI